MDNVISRGGVVNESGIFVPLNESALEYATHMSRNLKIVSNMFDGDAKAVALSEDCKNVILSSSTGEKAVVFLEDYLEQEFRKYLRKF